MPEAATAMDEHHMRRCLALAERGAGHVSPNPLVGAVIVKGGKVLGEGWHQQYGGPHAEREAIADAEARHGAGACQGATCYVNLEPCSHRGKTPPCTDALIERGFARVVAGMVDPFPRVDGSGLARLRADGIEATAGVLEAACQRLNEAFTHHLRTGRPLVTLKIAQTLDGRTATDAGDSRWVSGPEARALVHRWRSRLDAVLIGSGTARADDPALTVRHVEGRQPLRVVLDRAGTLPPGLRLFTDAHTSETVAVVVEGVRPPYADALEAAGGRLFPVPLAGGHLDLGALLDRLGTGAPLLARPVQSVLVEAGPGLATALLDSGWVDRLCLFIAPKVLGGGRPSFGGLTPERMADAHAFAAWTWERVGDDLLFRGFAKRVGA